MWFGSSPLATYLVNVERRLVGSKTAMAQHDATGTGNGRVGLGGPGDVGTNTQAMNPLNI